MDVVKNANQQDCEHSPLSKNSRNDVDEVSSPSRCHHLHQLESALSCSLGSWVSTPLNVSSPASRGAAKADSLTLVSSAVGRKASKWMCKWAKVRMLKDSNLSS
ncbi:unnamed protein product [Taenia asiatica]|uniref:Uncharacterized protein n=1 Tax=Taenia asiatica TaxID=60517 RepID=A0A0R3WGV5_TAEAS|nr:unnamed protein product [Taenia asiatica]